jgi:hypothetical protein
MIKKIKKLIAKYFGKPEIKTNVITEDVLLELGLTTKKCKCGHDFLTIKYTEGDICAECIYNGGEDLK